MFAFESSFPFDLKLIIPLFVKFDIFKLFIEFTSE